MLPFLSGLVLVNATYVLTGNDEFLLRYLAPTLPPVALGAGIAAAASRRPAVRRVLPVAAGAASLVALALWLDVAGAFYVTDLGTRLGI